MISRINFPHLLFILIYIYICIVCACFLIFLGVCLIPPNRRRLKHISAPSYLLFSLTHQLFLDFCRFSLGSGRSNVTLCLLFVLSFLFACFFLLMVSLKPHRIKTIQFCRFHGAKHPVFAGFPCAQGVLSSHCAFLYNMCICIYIRALS